MAGEPNYRRTKPGNGPSVKNILLLSYVTYTPIYAYIAVT